jgi:ADP-heptose:LPS heptosyltransferase
LKSEVIERISPPIRRVLLVQLRGLGEVVLCTPAVRQLRRALPAARLDFLADRPGAEALAGSPWLDGVLVHERGWARGWRRAREIRARRSG